jgi:hypothetical protein
LLTPSTPAAGGGAGAGAGGADEVGDDDALRMVVEQRERARRHADELEAEIRRHRDQTKSQQSEIRKLHADNLRLFEKAKFLEANAAAGAGSAASGAASGGGGGGKVAPPVGRNSIAEASTEGRYSQMYEEKVNPFAAFHRRERQQRYDGLHPAEKVVLNFAKFVAANKHARIFLVGYIICLRTLRARAARLTRSLSRTPTPPALSRTPWLVRRSARVGRHVRGEPSLLGVAVGCQCETWRCTSSPAPGLRRRGA